MDRQMPAAYAEPKANTNAHLAWARGYTWAEWNKLGRGDRMIETLLASGETPTVEERANLLKLNGNGSAFLAALRGA